MNLHMWLSCSTLLFASVVGVTWDFTKSSGDFLGHKVPTTCLNSAVSSPFPQQSSWKNTEKRLFLPDARCGEQVRFKTAPHQKHQMIPCCEKLPESWWRRLCWEILRRPQPWCTQSHRSWSVLSRSVDKRKVWVLFWRHIPQSEQVVNNSVCVAYCVPVHEAPDRCSHFTSKQDHQKEEKLKTENSNGCNLKGSYSRFHLKMTNELIKLINKQ